MRKQLFQNPGHEESTMSQKQVNGYRVWIIARLCGREVGLAGWNIAVVAGSMARMRRRRGRKRRRGRRRKSKILSRRFGGRPSRVQQYLTRKQYVFSSLLAQSEKSSCWRGALTPWYVFRMHIPSFGCWVLRHILRWTYPLDLFQSFL